MEEYVTYDKNGKKVLIVKMHRFEGTHRTVASRPLRPFVCEHFCEKGQVCRLWEQGMQDLCPFPEYKDKFHVLVRRPKHRSVDAQELRELREERRKRNAEPVSDFDRPTRAEDYSATPVVSGEFPEAVQDSHPLDYLDDPVVTTRSEIKRHRDMREAQRRERFLMNHGFRLRDKLMQLQKSDPAKAKRVASKLTLEDWKAVCAAGGLRSS